MWSDERDDIMLLLDESDEKFPRECPCCGKKEGHIFFYKNHQSDRIGSAWAWCSDCKEYSHSRFVIPNWWKNYDLINLDELHGCPDNLDEKSKEIDSWVNKLLEEKERSK